MGLEHWETLSECVYVCVCAGGKGVKLKGPYRLHFVDGGASLHHVNDTFSAIAHPRINAAAE